MKKQSLSVIFFRSLNAIDLVTFTYLLITGAFILWNYQELHQPGLHLLMRLGIFSFVALLIFVQQKKNHKWIEFIHWLYPIILLAYLFKETAYLNHIFYHHYLDGWLIAAEKELFGYLPSIVFSKNFHETWFSELMNFGYFSYYFMTVGIAMLFLLRYPEETERVIFIMLTSFFTYYLFFIFFPTEGPVYFLQAPLNEQIHSGVFSHLVNLADKIGDGRTGAFPSSHVGMAVIYVILTFRRFPKLFGLITFLTILICFATVYIKAHYFLDALGGLVSAPLIYMTSNWLYNRILISKGKLFEIVI